MDKDPIVYVYAYLLITVVRTLTLFIAMRWTKIEGKIVHLFLASAISSLLNFIPFIGFILSLTALTVLISLWTNAEVWPDAALMVAISWGISNLALIYLLVYFD